MSAPLGAEATDALGQARGARAVAARWAKAEESGRAIESLSTAVSLFKVAGEVDEAATSELALCNLLRIAGRLGEACEALDRCQRAAPQGSELHVYSLSAEALLKVLLDDRNEAVAIARKAVDCAVAADLGRLALARAWLSLASVSLEADDLDTTSKAVQHADRLTDNVRLERIVLSGRTIRRAFRARARTRAMTLEARARVGIAQSRPMTHGDVSQVQLANAETALNEAIKWYIAADELPDKDRCVGIRAGVREQLGDLKGAAEDYDRAYLGLGSWPLERAERLAGWARTVLAQGDAAAAAQPGVAAALALDAVRHQLPAAHHRLRAAGRAGSAWEVALAAAYQTDDPRRIAELVERSRAYGRPQVDESAAQPLAEITIESALPPLDDREPWSAPALWADKSVSIGPPPELGLPWGPALIAGYQIARRRFPGLVGHPIEEVQLREELYRV